MARGRCRVPFQDEMDRPLVISVAASATFIAGFGAAELTGVRAVGGLVLLVGGVWCARSALKVAGSRATAALVVIGLAAFVLSHPLGHAIGAWPAVAVSAAVVGAAVAGLLTWGRRGPTALEA
jgi:hypothetical protein